jgi:4a-hydroxytetrahydrobiopterin dehydratase
MDSDLEQALAALPRWKLRGKAIERVYEFGNFAQAMKFVNQVAEQAEAANHHPDITINYNRVTLSLTSHDAGSLTRSDLSMAHAINEIAGLRGSGLRDAAETA